MWQKNKAHNWRNMVRISKNNYLESFGQLKNKDIVANNYTKAANRYWCNCFVRKDTTTSSSFTWIFPRI